MQRKSLEVERAAGVGHHRQSQQQPGQNKGAHHDAEREQSCPAHADHKIAEYRLDTGGNSGDQLATAIVDERNREGGNGENNESKHRSANRAEQQETADCFVAGDEMAEIGGFLADHETIDGAGIGNPDQEEQGADQRNYPATPWQLAETMPDGGQLRFAVAALGIGQGEKTDEQSRANQHETTGQRDTQRRDAVMFEAEEDQSADEDEYQGIAHAQQWHEAELLPAVADGVGKVGEMEFARLWGRIIHGACACGRSLGVKNDSSRNVNCLGIDRGQFATMRALRTASASSNTAIA